jgi:hypothetical protein
MTKASRGSELVKATAIFVSITLIFLLLFEGGASLIRAAHAIFFSAVAQGPVVSENVHTEYDELLGWINLPNFRDPDLYGPGIYFTTNGQRFRNKLDFAKQVPEGKIRIVCSGDSYTLGHSVNDDQTWCQRLTTFRSDIETVNMGQGGYGVDQAYLWYARDGKALDHDIQIFAFIAPDFDRMRSDRFIGFGKPVLRVVDGVLQVQNVPVPVYAKPNAWFERVASGVRKLAVVELGQAVLSRAGVARPVTVPPALSEDEVRASATQIFADLQRINAEKGSVLVTVMLPRSEDREYRTADLWRSFMYGLADRTGIVFIDLIEEFRRLPIDEGQHLFISPYHASHYNAKGNAWAAELLYARLQQVPALRTKLAR